MAENGGYMSDLSVTVSTTGLVGLEKSSTAGALLNKSGAPEQKEADKIATITEAAEAEKIAPADVEIAVQDLNVFMQSMQRNLSFSIDEQLGQAIISVTDVETNEVIRQIPSEELVVLRKKMDDVVGILFDTKV